MSRSHEGCLPVARAFLVVVLATLSAHAALEPAAEDNASNYGSAYAGENGGFGFDTWVVRSEESAGSFVASTNDNAALEGIASEPGGKAWGSYANGNSTFDSVVAFRGFGWDGQDWANALTRAGDTFSISFEHGVINLDSSCGFVLRNGNQDFTASDYNAGSRFEFGYYAGSTALDANYAIYDAGGKRDTGVPTRTSGLDLLFALTATNAYRLTLIDAQTHGTLTNITGTLAGSGKLDSLAQFNRNTDEGGAIGDVFFNNLRIDKYYPPTAFVVK
jgi:hypothetical protein